MYGTNKILNKYGADEFATLSTPGKVKGIGGADRLLHLQYTIQTAVHD